MNKYIFLSNEGSTYQPIKNTDPDIVENIQVIGFSDGINPDEALSNLVSNNPHIKETTFNHIYCYKLDSDFEENRVDYFLKDI